MIFYRITWFCCLPVTLLGYIVALLGFAYPYKMDANWVVHWRPLPFGIHALIFSRGLAGAYTMGANTVWNPLAETWGQPWIERTKLHEFQHTKQAARWCFAAVCAYLLCYGVMAGYSLMRTGNVWGANPWEQEAIKAEQPK